MDREVKENYQVVIQAKDMAGQMGGLSGTTTVSIMLSDVNDNPPRFTKREYGPDGAGRTRRIAVRSLACENRLWAGAGARQAAPIWCQFQNEFGLLQGALGFLQLRRAS